MLFKNKMEQKATPYLKLVTYGFNDKDGGKRRVKADEYYRSLFFVMPKKTVLRAFASSLLSLLLIATVTWGGCISCKQYFMWPGAKDCCSGKGHCKGKPIKHNSATETKQNSVPECKQIAFGSQKSFALHVDFSAIGDMRVGLPVPTAGILVSGDDVSPIEPSPPDLQALHSTFLI